MRSAAWDFDDWTNTPDNNPTLVVPHWTEEACSCGREEAIGRTGDGELLGERCMEDRGLARCWGCSLILDADAIEVVDGSPLCPTCEVGE